MPISKITLKDQAHDYIKNAIVSKELEQDKIYSVPELSSMLNISRTPVREAMLQLEQEGFVTILPNKGMKIKAFDKRTVMDIYQSRMAIEGFCSYYLADHVQNEEVQKIINFLEMLHEENLKGYNAGSSVNNDFLFHQKIIEFSGNERFVETNENMRLYMNLFTGKLNRWDKANLEHAQILNAIKNGDPQLARKMSYEHILNTYKDIIAMGALD